jgi:hypothetical protein
MSEEEKVINRLIADVQHLNKLVQWQAAENRRLREALRTIADGDTPREHAIVYRSDGVHSKHDKCKHGAWMYDGCEDCVAEYARAALGEGKE